MRIRLFRYRYYNRVKIFQFCKERNIPLSWLDKCKLLLNFQRKIELPFVDFDVTTYCNLRCKRCAKCLPFFEEKRHFSAEKLKNDLESLVKYLDRIYVVSIIGGEPFLNPEIAEIIRICSDCSKIFQLELTTNGTVMPPEEVFSALQNSRVHVHISLYDFITVKQKQTRDALIAKLEDYNIPYEFASHPMWLDFGDVVHREYPPHEKRVMFYQCPMNSCSIFNNRVLYRCGKSSYLHQHGKIPVNDAVIRLDEIHSRKEMRKAVHRFFNVRTLLACSYCSNHPTEIKAGEQLDRGNTNADTM